MLRVRGEGAGRIGPLADIPTAPYPMVAAIRVPSGENASARRSPVCTCVLRDGKGT
ncbi:hypothetical protein GCM10023205_83760 [Yinghuangia aomiensis]|uniref:Uncharacterized protein n=1 Tax=Yinghuangia aomiensis TaxID=676205 RepID=A0ABP9IGI7_9ACTN